MTGIIERGDVLARLSSLRQAAFLGRGGTALVCGAAALGKSAVLDAFASAAAEDGALTMTAAGAEAERDLPLGVLTQFLLAPALPEPDRAYIRGLITAAEGGNDGCGGHGAAGRLSPDRARLAEQWCTRLTAISARRPLAIVVDDVHHADPGSLACLEYLLRRIRHARVVLVLGYSDESAYAASSFRLNVLRQPNSCVIDLAPLSPCGVTALLATGLGAERAARVSAACYAASGGNPLLTRGLVRDQSESMRTGAGDPAVIGDGYARAVLSCLRRSSASMLEAARGIAVLGESSTLGTLLDLGPTRTSAVLRDLARTGLILNGRFRHPVARQAVLGDIPEDRRTRLFAAAAEIAHTAARPGTEVADYLVAAGRADAPWAVPLLEEAARTELAEGRLSTAIGYLRLARTGCVKEPDRSRLTMLLLRAEWRISPAGPAGMLDELLADLDGHRLDAEAATVLVQALLWHGRSAEAVRVLRKLAAGDAGSGPEVAADLTATRSWLRALFPPLVEHVPAAETAPEGVVSGSGSRLRNRLKASAALEGVLRAGPSARLFEDAERVLRTSRPENVSMSAVESALLALAFGEQSRRAALACDRLIETAIEPEATSRRARLSAIRAEIGVRLGDLAAGERHAREALELIPAAGWGVVLGVCLGSLLTCLTRAGRHQDADGLVAEPVPPAMLGTSYGLLYLRARGHHLLATDDPDGALADFLACGELMRAWQIDQPALVPWRTDAAEALLALGARDRALSLAEEALRRCDRAVYPRAHGAALRVLAACGERRRRPALLGQAVEVLQESEDRYLLALTLCDLVEAHQELGDTRRARMIGRQAWSIAQECRAETLGSWLAAHDVRPEPRPSGSVAMLSDAERRVADLVIQGYTNREIAGRLCITVSTVEQHLTRAYRKLGISGRADLASIGAARPARNAASGVAPAKSSMTKGAGTTAVCAALG